MTKTWEQATKEALEKGRAFSKEGRQVITKEEAEEVNRLLSDESVYDVIADRFFEEMLSDIENGPIKIPVVNESELDLFIDNKIKKWRSRIK